MMADTKTEKRTSIGGQALIEGVMMRGPHKTAMAVRDPAGQIVLEQWDNPVNKRPAWTKWPFVRGLFNFYDSMRYGYKCLMRSAELSGLDDEDDGKAKKTDEKKAETARAADGEQGAASAETADAEQAPERVQTTDDEQNAGSTETADAAQEPERVQTTDGEQGAASTEMADAEQEPERVQATDDEQNTGSAEMADAAQEPGHVQTTDGEQSTGSTETADAEQEPERVQTADGGQSAGSAEMADAAQEPERVQTTDGEQNAGSAEMADAEQEPGRVQDTNGKQNTRSTERSMTAVMIAATVLGVGLALILFMWLPIQLFSWLAKAVPELDHRYIRGVFEGVLRIVIFLAYMLAVSRMKDIRRTFQYHGAEHKTIFCYEKGLPLTVENVRPQRRFHPRCGTSFLILMLIVGILISILIPIETPLLRTVVKLLLLPLTVGIGYELIKLAGRKDNAFTRIISAPGMWMQHITTIEPDDGMIECAIASLKAVIPNDPEDDRW